MCLFRLFIGTLYDLGQLMSALLALFGIFYLLRAVVVDSQADFYVALSHFGLSVAFWVLARIFRRYAV